MFKDVIIPTVIRNYYIFETRIISFEITTDFIQGLLLNCYKKEVTVEKKMIIPLKDTSLATISAAIKKIISSFGHYDEIIYVVSSAHVIYKELELPFLGYDTLHLVVPYEVQEMLPFPLEQAYIDFLIIDENQTKKSSKILVAAILKQDIELYISYFEKVKYSVSVITADLFAWYETYRAWYQKRFPIVTETKKVPKGKQSEELVIVQSHVEFLISLEYNCTIVLYMINGIVKSHRVILYGLADLIEHGVQNYGMAYQDVIARMVQSEQNVIVGNSELLEPWFQQVKNTILVFEQQLQQSYALPQQIYFVGWSIAIQDLLGSAHKNFTIPVDYIPTEQLLADSNKKLNTKKDFRIDTVLVGALFPLYNKRCNFVQSFMATDNILLLKQLVVIVLLTILCIGGIFWQCNQRVNTWEKSYIASKKEMSNKIQQVMNIDVSNYRNPNELLQHAQEQLLTERKLWFAFSKQQDQSYLEYLQDLTTHIDQADLQLQLKKVIMQFDKIELSGTLSKGLESWTVFQDELRELELFELAEEPRDITFAGNKITFDKIELHLKQKEHHAVD